MNFLIFHISLESITGVYTPLFNEMKKYTDDTGDQIINGVIAELPKLEQTVDSGDRSAILKILMPFIPLWEKALKHVENPKLEQLSFRNFEKFKTIVQQLEQGASLNILRNYYKDSAAPVEKTLDSIDK